MSQKAQVTRRKFIGTTAAAGVAASVAIGPQRALAATDRMKVGFIGVGGRGGSNLKTISGTGAVDVIAVCDIDRRSVDRAAEKHAGAKKFRDFRKLYDAVGKELDAVVVSTTEHTHAYATMPALQLGKHVY